MLLNESKAPPVTTSREKSARIVELAFQIVDRRTDAGQLKAPIIKSPSLERTGQGKL
ncbi:hypothetical protein [Erwinia sp. S59]|uniref:hypothetical protein n=1 Tax=Erwinia sp. S59 TaxID=2769340 RepID=UPI00190C202A|nr:hypothetical protein [Erwinia sp. S59]MBK0092812.1 hypothetical protein [Erwinia sp. S59]